MCHFRFCIYNKMSIADRSRVNMQHSPRHISGGFDPIYNLSYLSDPSHGCPQVEDFPAQNVRQKCRDYAGKNKATTRRHSSVTGMDADLWAKCNKLLRAEKRLSKLFITSTCIHVIVLVFVTISVSYTYM